MNKLHGTGRGFSPQYRKRSPLGYDLQSARQLLQVVFTLLALQYAAGAFTADSLVAYMLRDV